MAFHEVPDLVSSSPWSSSAESTYAPTAVQEDADAHATEVRLASGLTAALEGTGAMAAFQPLLLAGCPRQWSASLLHSLMTASATWAWPAAVGCAVRQVSVRIQALVSL